MKLLRKMITPSVRLQSTAAVSTFQFQKDLPHLPVPQLEETAERYLKSIKPLVLDKKYADTERIVKDFVKPGGVGEVLQKRLLERAASKKNWMYEWWNESAYMAYRDPIVPYVSYFYSYKDQFDTFPEPVKRAAALVSNVLAFKSKYDAETLVPDYMRKKPIDMELFRFMFNSCRIPKPGADECAQYESKGNEHIIVLRKNHVYKLPYLDGGRQLTTEELEGKLRAIYADAELKPEAPNVGGLTSENRDKWVDMRAHLVEASPQNAQTLETIQSAAFVVNLDWAAPSTNLERTHQYWHGYNRNRFYDKPLQFIVNDNGTAGFMGEHSMMDGMHTLRLNEDVLSGLLAGKEMTKGVQIDTDVVEELPFVVNDQVLLDIAEAEADFVTEIEKHEVAVWAFKGFGKDLIKTFKVSPDGFLQMLLQLAYYRMNGLVRPVYEAATTRKYFQGRTETIRSVSTESVEFCKKFWDASVPAADKIAAFRAAIKSQGAYVADASEGHGVDRHLFGLKRSILPGEELPEIFKDPVFSYSSTWFLSTSQLSSEYFNGYGWSQVTPKGFGFAYMINKNDLHVNICSQYMGSNRMMEYLDDSANKLAKLLSEEAPAARL